MTAKEAFEAQEILKEFRKGLDSLSESKLIGALDLAIKALGKDINVPVNDCISRQAAIDALDCINGTEEVLRSLPSAQPDGISLEWLDNCDNDFAQLAKVGIKAMVEIWKKDKI